MKRPPRPHPLFWIKTILHRVVPGGIGHYRIHRRHRDTGYVHDRDKHAVRHKHHGQGGWAGKTTDGLARRDYGSYEEYLTHQKQKFDEMLKMYGGFRGEDIFNYRRRFYARFKHLPDRLPREARILCLGARQGTEVEVLRDLGFKNAWGIDLNPGPHNPFVRPGDFMHLDAPDNSLDLIYSNCVDHAFDLTAFFTEHARALKHDGYIIYDLGVNMEEGGGAFEAVAWERTEQVFEMLLRHFQKLIRVEREPQWMWVMLQGKRQEPPDHVA